MNAVPNVMPIRRLDDVVDLAQPSTLLFPAIAQWVSEVIGHTVYTFEQLVSLHDRCKREVLDAARPGWHLTDLYCAVGALRAHKFRPRDGWQGYIDAFERKRVVQRISKDDKTDFSRLRELEIEVGGILINDRACPFLLICPQPDHTWLTMGFESLMLFSQSPLRGKHGKQSLIRSHVPVQSFGPQGVELSV